MKSAAKGGELSSRERVVRAAVWLLESGLVVGTTGNISVREDGEQCFLITPSGFDYRFMEADDIACVNLSTGATEGRRRPSSEWGLHAQIYKARKDVRAVVHSHSPYATAVAVARKTIPSILDEAADLTPVRTLEYAPSGSVELATTVASTIANGSNAVLLANHGVAVVGGSLNEALRRSVDVERLAQLFVWAEAVGGAVPLEGWAVERGRDFLRRYAATRSEHEPESSQPLPVWPGSVSVADLIRFGFRSWVTFGSMFQALLMEKLRR